jgi:two-component system response regulator HydG
MRPAPDGYDPEGPRTRLLVVEDEMSTIFALRSFFALGGFDVDCAAGPRDGLSLLDRRPYDAVITDLQLTPRREAEGLTIASRARERNPGACVVLLTAFGSDATERRARLMGVDLYFTKPVELGVVRAGIDNVLAERTVCRRS